MTEPNAAARWPSRWPSRWIDTLFPDVPRTAVWLGLAGLLPFYGCVLAAYLLPHPWNGWGLTLLKPYGAVILSFLGGVHWGLAMAGFGSTRAPGPGHDPMTDPPDTLTWVRLGWSVMPSIVAWAAFFLTGWQAGFVLLLLAFVAMLYGDLRAVEAGAAPAWYLSLRRNLTWLVVLALTLAIARPLIPYNY